MAIQTPEQRFLMAAELAGVGEFWAPRGTDASVVIVPDDPMERATVGLTWMA
jgi:hypothetical protein